MRTPSPIEHPFLRAPHATLFSLSLPVLFSLAAEPLTGLVDTAFVSRLGAESLAALGVGTVALSSFFWVFGFLGIGTQTEVAQAFGQRDARRAARLNGLALVLGMGVGVCIVVAGFPFIPRVAQALGAAGPVHAYAVAYMRIRWFGAPAVLITLVAFGTLRGLQEMRAPLWIAVTVNGLNIGLDVLLIFGAGPIPPLGVSGAALASVASQWAGASWALYAVYARLGPPDRLDVREARVFLHAGKELVIRTAFLNAFLLLTTRTANRIGVEAGAAHQAIRQVWVFTSLLLDAFAVVGQSLVGYFMGSQRIVPARRVARVVCTWGAGVGFALAAAMLLSRDAVRYILVPAAAADAFVAAWIVASVAQPFNALAFVTDGIHWGTGDFRYLRHAVTVATLAGAAGILLLDVRAPEALARVWGLTAGWIVIRACFGMARIWPGVGACPLKERGI